MLTGGGARPAHVLVRLVEHVLVVGVGVDRRHEARLDADEVVQHLGDGRQAVGRARGVGDDLVLGLELVVVDAVDDGEVRALRRRRDQHALGAGLECTTAFSLSVKMPVHSRTMSMPSDFQGSFLGSRSASTLMGPLPTSIELALDLHLAGKAAVHAVVAQQVRVVLGRNQVVDGDDLQIRALGLDHRRAARCGRCGRTRKLQS